MRKFLLTLFILVFSFSLAQELSFWTWRGEDEAAYKEMFAVYEAANPGVSINFQAFPNQEYATKLSAALAADEAGDILHVRAYGGFEALAEPGYLMALDDKVPALADFNPLAVQGETLRSDGRVYAVPFASQSLVIYYNTRIFEELGLSPASTWDDFLALSATIQEGGYIPIANGTATSWIDELMFGALGPAFYGADFYDKVVAGETTFEDEAFVYALGRMLELTPYFPPDHIGVDYESSQQLFINEMAAMFIGGSWEIAYFRAQNPDLAFNVAAVPAANADEAQITATFLDGGYAINSKTAHSEAAVNFINWLASAEFGQMLSDKLANISPVPGVEPQDELLLNISEFNQSATPYLMLVGFRYPEYQPNGSIIIRDALQPMFAGKLSPAETAKMIQEGIAPNHPPFKN